VPHRSLTLYQDNDRNNYRSCKQKIYSSFKGAEKMKKIDTEIQPLTDEQMKEVERAILQFYSSGKISLFAAKGLIFLLRKSGNLTKEVTIRFNDLIPSQKKKGREVSYAAHDICGSSGAGDNRVNNVIRRMGSLFYFFGHYSETIGLGATLSLIHPRKKTEKISFTVNEIENMEL